MQFSDTTNLTGLVEMLAVRTGTLSATTSSYPIKQKTVDINQALATFLAMAQQYSKNWKVDDTNNSGVPVYVQNLVSGTQTYTFATDGTNEILAIDRVDILDSNSNGIRLKQLNRAVISEQAMSELNRTTGTPEYYDLVGKTLTLYPAPNYNKTNGLLLFNERAGSYFVSTDTTKVAGIPRIFHEYLYLRPAYHYCATKGLSQAKFLQIEVDKMEQAIQAFYESRNKESNQNELANGIRVNNKVAR